MGGVAWVRGTLPRGLPRPRRAPHPSFRPGANRSWGNGNVGLQIERGGRAGRGRCHGWRCMGAWDPTAWATPPAARAAPFVQAWRQSQLGKWQCGPPSGFLLAAARFMFLPPAGDPALPPGAPPPVRAVVAAGELAAACCVVLALAERARGLPARPPLARSPRAHRIRLYRPLWLGS